MRILLAIIFLLFYSKLYSQEKNIDSLKVLNSINDDKYKIELIPENAFTGEFDLLVISNITNEKNNDNIIAIHWSNYAFDDKRYKLVINPRQIYFRTVSYTPNSKSLFWKSNISEEQFLKIKKYIQENKESFIVDHNINSNDKFSYWFEKSKTGKNKTQPNYNIEINRTYKNFKRLINFINKSFIHNENRINIPTKNNFKKIKKIRVIYHIDDLDMEMSPLKRIKK